LKKILKKTKFVQVEIIEQKVLVFWYKWMLAFLPKYLYPIFVNKVSTTNHEPFFKLTRIKFCLKCTTSIWENFTPLKDRLISCKCANGEKKKKSCYKESYQFVLACVPRQSGN